MRLLTRRTANHAVAKLALAALIVVFGMSAVPASADELISVDSDGILFASPGSRTAIAEASVDAGDVGRLCTLQVLSENQVSVHPGNNLIVRTGGVETVIADVEAAPGSQVDRAVDVILGDTITVDLQMGPDGISSFGFDLSLSCPTDEPVLSNTGTTCTEAGGGSAGGQNAGGPNQGPSGANESTTGGTAGCSTTPTSVPSTQPSTQPPAQPPTPPSTQPATEFTLPPSPATTPPCVDGTDASATGGLTGGLTVGPAGCPQPTTEPTPAPTTVPEATTAPPTTQPPTTATPPTTPDASSTNTTAPVASSTNRGRTPQVLGIQIEPGLPVTPAATAIPAAPTYNG